MGVFDLFTTAKAPTSVNFASGGKHALDTVAQQAAAAAARSSAHFPHPVLDPRVHLLPSVLTFPTAVRNAFPTYSAFLHPTNYLSFYTTHADSFQSAIAICIGFSVYVYVMQEITGNASQVDGLWTFLPVIYTTHFTLFSTGTFTWPAPRLLLLWALHVLWSTRLTYNAIRRGMFKKGEEDYRWPLLRASMNRITWEIFTITFIAPAQNFLLAITALPAYVLSLLARPEYFANQPTRPTTQLTPADGILALLLITNLTVQFIADHQQQLYQGFKRGLDITCTKPITLPADKLLLLQGGTSPAGVVTKNGKAAQQHPDNVPLYHGFTNGDKKRGFVTRGLWAWSRHPNFACEQTTWWIFYAYTVITFLPPSTLIDLGTTPAGASKIGAVTSKLAAKVAEKIAVPASLVSPPWWTYIFNYAVLGAVSMNILFLASTAYSEGVSAGKYPAYASYQKRVGMFLPVDTLLRGIYYWFVAPDNVRERIEAEVWGAEGSAEKKNN
ncbi:hypothetical protein OC846_001864 [Tilletia horrida]|uniref:DUF1295-domain-containing protein n=1 Tax=Tilletia horrida TaxID=155126 RepID=A0AAN6GSY4_9BASI|nr:hypothetical protein OC846_001864 [Tilletia horrida]KAK0568381.1 hypothetical protein OC861_002010 [Tilletia horrida]